MTQEEKQLLLKDISVRLAYGLICSTPKGNGHLCSINQTIFGNEYGVNIEVTKRDYFNDNECDIKPYLRPMDSMTEEEEKEYCNFLDGEHSNPNDLVWLATNITEWLNRKMFDYRGLIPMDLALPAPKGIY